MALQLGVKRLMAVVHPNNHCVFYWMNKLKGYKFFKDEWYAINQYYEYIHDKL